MCFFVFKQKTAYEMRISDWSSDVCSSDLQEVDFTLLVEEADFLRARLKNACIDQTGRGHEYNLFGTFSRYRRKTLVRAAWEHPKVAELRPSARDQIGRASCRERVCQYV